MKKFIVKVQTPLITSDSSELVLIYNKGRTVLEEFRLKKTSMQVLRKVMHGENKEFFYAHTSSDNILVLDELARWQDW